jgi:2-hydroxy-3-oxopropionate reductase
MKVGFIGLGLMGRPMALNLIKGGHQVTVWARRAESMAPLLSAGAKAAVSPAALAAAVEVVVTMVGDGPDVEGVHLGTDGVIAGGKPGLIAIDMSTIPPGTARKVAAALAAKDIAFLDAPVSGGVVGAEAGSLSIMVGGSAAAFAKALPVLQSMGKNIVHIGESGAGQVTKACNQIVVGLNTLAVAEAFCFARKAGVDPAKVREALLGGFAYSKSLENHGQRMLDRNFKPGFKAWMHQKDLNIVLREAHAMNLGLPGAALDTQIMNAVVGMGMGEDDSLSVLRVLEKMNGLDPA